MGYVPKVINTPKDENSSWSFSTEDSNALEKKGWKEYEKAFAWVDEGSSENPPEKKESYHLPHHKLKNGKLTLYWSGVRAAMAAINGARNKPNMTVEERRKAYNHLVAHYKAFGKEPPEFKEDVDTSFLRETIKKHLR
jgi:hypothetical protein